MLENRGGVSTEAEDTLKDGWLVVLFYSVSTLFRPLNAELNVKQFGLA